VVLQDTAERSFHHKFRWKTLREFIHVGDYEATPFDCKDCSNCVFREQNDLVEAIINPEMEDFV
jgi:hypothetical protein